MSEELRNKLVNYQAEPPARVWEAVREALEDDEPVIRQRLFDYHANPPAAAWENISEKINEEARVVPISGSRSPILKYALIAAAILAVVIAVTVLTRKDVGNDIAHKDPPAPTTNQPQASPPKPNPDTQQSINDPSQNNAVVINPAAVIRDPDPRYLTVAKQDGKKVRLSKKVYPEINCAEKTAATTWSKCKENIQALQTKMATSLNASSTDFGGLLDMLKDLEENH